jgi:calcineurin-like phosphoesterase family protein
MLKPIKFEQTETQKIYFWGCTHVFHKKDFIWQKRGYSSMEEHAEAIRNKINSTCTEHDILFHLGDGFLNSSIEQVEPYLHSLKPKIQYILGNHESSITKLYRKYRDYQYGHLINFNENTEIYPLTYKSITFWGNYLECYINKREFVLSHFPFKVFNSSARGALHCHSHCHGGLPSSLPDAKEGLILDVGVDVFSERPVSLDKVLEIMDKKEVKHFDDHH